jgi:hypothetical protein
VITVFPPTRVAWISLLGDCRARIIGILFKIAIPSGNPIMVIFKNQAKIIDIAPSHHPMKMNHNA